MLAFPERIIIEVDNCMLAFSGVGFVKLIKGIPNIS